MDASLLVGFPGSIASTWQQAGRAGRGLEDSVVFLIAQNSPIDQFLMNHHEYLFSRNPENAIVDAIDAGLDSLAVLLRDGAEKAMNRLHTKAISE